MEVDSSQSLLPSESWSVRQIWEAHHENNVNLKVGQLDKVGKLIMKRM